ncbi:MAG: class I SAM-dependent methyltransferase [Cyclobacteriaceae bacterium]
MEELHITHYEKCLARHYDWMIGDPEQFMLKMMEFFKAHQVESHGIDLAIDLGTGNGLQSIPLANLGYKVVAVDTSAKMLKQLKQREGYSDRITCVQADMVEFLERPSDEASLIICMGDSLAYLPSFDALDRFFSGCFNKLSARGKVVITCREYGSSVKGDQRFIPIRTTENKIMTVFLEYEKCHVKITDQIYTFKDGSWNFQVGSYYKLRLTCSKLIEYATLHCLQIIHCKVTNGMVEFVAMKPC